MKSCLIVPVYNHPGTIRGVLESAATLNLPCYLVDDGSNAETARVLDDLDERYEWVRLERLPDNRGKGVALTRGFRRAVEDGRTHAVTIDADGQHDVSDVPRFIEAAEANQGSVIIGDPVFDDSAPRSRYYGRKLSRFWVMIETLSTDLHDPLIGFRCYPLERTLSVIEKYDPGVRMEFDPEILVQFYWEFGSVVNLSTDVTYSTGEESHFDLVRDNVRISFMHMRLFFGMLKRVPRLLGRSDT